MLWWLIPQHLEDEGRRSEGQVHLWVPDEQRPAWAAQKERGKRGERREGRREKQRVAERGKDERKYKERRLVLDVPQMCTCWV